MGRVVSHPMLVPHGKVVGGDRACRRPAHVTLPGAAAPVLGRARHEYFLVRLAGCAARSFFATWARTAPTSSGSLPREAGSAEANVIGHERYTAASAAMTSATDQDDKCRTGPPRCRGKAKPSVRATSM